MAGPVSLKRLTPADYRRTRWKNGRGWTTELAAWPAGAHFDWRVSIAEVDADCEFSVFPGIDRSILVLSGAGMELQVGDAPPRTLRPGDGPFRFPGDLPARARLLGGPTRDFNVMTRRGVCEHGLRELALAGPSELDRPAGTGWLAYLVNGHAEAGGLEVAAGDCLLAEPGLSTGTPLGMRGAGLVVAVRLQLSGRQLPGTGSATGQGSVVR